MKKFIKSSISPAQLGEILLTEIMKIQNEIDINHDPMRLITFEISVSFSNNRNPICSIILNG